MTRHQKKKVEISSLNSLNEDSDESGTPVRPIRRFGFQGICDESSIASLSDSSESSDVTESHKSEKTLLDKNVGPSSLKKSAQGTSTVKLTVGSQNKEALKNQAKEQPKSEKDNGRPKEKKGKQQNEEEDFDAMVSQLKKMSMGEKKNTQKPSPTNPKDNIHSDNSFKETAGESLAPEDSAQIQDEGSTGQTAVSAKTLKNRQKRLKKKKANETEEIAESEKNPVNPPNASSKSGSMSVAARLAQQRRLLIESEQKRLEEEKKRQEEMERKRLEEEQEALRKKEEEKERKRQARLEAKQRQRREGKPVTMAEKEKAKRMEEARQLLLEQMNQSSLTFQQSTGHPTTKKKSGTSGGSKKPKRQIQASCITMEPVASLSVIEREEEPDVEEKTVGQEKVAAPEEKTFRDISDWEKSDDEDIGQEDSNVASANVAPVKSHPHGSIADEEKLHTVPGNKSTPKDVSESCKTLQVKQEALSSSLPHPTNVENTQTVSTKEPILRSPICCILGHVDTGKTKLLDKIRNTDVQASEAGGITQQIGSTFFPKASLLEQCRKVEKEYTIDIPGLLIIDTPGHESFNNLRSRGSSLCDIAILVVDIMHGLEPQTRESLELLRGRKCPFLIALNKIDRLYEWQPKHWQPARESLQVQKDSTQQEFSTRLANILLQLAETGLNCNLWWEIDNVKKTVSVVPTSALTGEGIPDLLYLLVNLTQSIMTRCLQLKDQFQCTVLEVKTLEGLGPTIDVILISGTLSVNDKLVICGLSGPIVTTIRALLTPQPLKELRVKGEYIHHKQISAAMGVKICAQNLEETVAGTSVFVMDDEEKLEQLQEDVMADMNSIIYNVDRSGIGVYVMASTLGSLEALLQFLKTSKIPVFSVNIGPVHKLDVKKASVMREKGHSEYSCILAFDVKVDVDATKEAQLLGVKIFTADIIYHLFDSFNKYVADVNDQKRKERQNEAIFPCILSIYANCIFNKKDPIVLGVKVEEGICKVGTPLCIPEKDNFYIGRIGSLEHNKKPVETAKRGDDVAIKIVGDTNIMYGRHFDHTLKIYSRINRDSIDYLKEFYRDDLKKEDWKLVVRMKKIFNIA